MIDYAAIDVKYLDQIYNHLQRIVSELNRDEAFAEKTYDLLLSPNLYTKVVQSAWKKIKYYKKDEKFIARLQAVSAFREKRRAGKVCLPGSFCIWYYNEV